MSDSEIIMEVMNSAPAFWSTIIDPHRCRDLIEFSAAIKYHEVSLEHSPFSSGDSSLDRRVRQLEQLAKDSRGSAQSRSNTTSKFSSFRNNFRSARTNLVGWSPSIGKPPFPKDDSVVSKGATPEDKKARPCRHCGSGKHWDYDCKHAKKGMKKVRANFATLSLDPEYLQAEQEYEAAYLEDCSSDSEVSDSEAPPDEIPNDPGNDREQDFPKALQCQVLSDLNSSPSSSKGRTLPSLRGLSVSSEAEGMKISRHSHDKVKIPQRFLNTMLWAKGYVSKAVQEAKGEILTLKRLMSRPPGCAFLGARATATKAWLNTYGENCTKVIIDSGANITLISLETLNSIKPTPKVRTGQRVNLIQVTGSSTISGFVSLPIFIDTEEGPIEVLLEAYVVKGMTTPFILGNDFADQYGISLI